VVVVVASTSRSSLLRENVEVEEDPKGELFDSGSKSLLTGFLFSCDYFGTEPLGMGSGTEFLEL